MKRLTLFLVFLLTASPAMAGIGAVGNGFQGIPDSSPPLHPRSGQLAPQAPVMTRTDARPFMSNGYRIEPIYAYSLRARVLSKEHYTGDQPASISPYDVVLGWQEMSDSNILDQLTISQGDRWWHYHYSHRIAGMSPEAISLEAGNMHLIPADDAARGTIAGLSKGNVVLIQGYLVRVHAPSGWNWVSGIGPDSEGPHGCKVVWVSKISVER